MQNKLFNSVFSKRKQDRWIYLLCVISCIVVLVLFINHYQAKARIKNIAAHVTRDSTMDKTRVIDLLQFASGIEVIHVKTISESELSQLRGMKWFWARFYRMLPVNLIPADIVLNYKLAYRGPCGARSKLLLPLLQSLGYDARLQELHENNFTPRHSIVEIRLNKEWVPLDPTYNLYFEHEDGSLAPTSSVAMDNDLFQNAINGIDENIHGVYPKEKYVYTNVSSMTVFYVAYRALYVLGFVNEEDAPILNEKMTRLIPTQIVNYDLGFPFFYEHPELLFPLSVCFIAAAFAGYLLWKK